jgi:hypothetical protein
VLLQAERQRHGPERKQPVHGVGAAGWQAQFQAAQAALALVSALLHDRPDAEALDTELEAARRKLTTAARLDNGWMELRPVLRPRAHVVRDQATGEIVAIEVRKEPFGPYLSYRWKEGRRQHSCYLGKPQHIGDYQWKLKALGVDIAGLNAPDLLALGCEPEESP